MSPNKQAEDPNPSRKLLGADYLILEKIEPLIFSLPHLRTKSLEYFWGNVSPFRLNMMDLMPHPPFFKVMD